MSSATVEALEQASFDEDDSFEQPPSDIVAYNELRSCADLYRMHATGILTIQPEFQREIVWKEPAQTRFIDSLMKQLPIPSMCFSLDYKTQKWQVIDGLQRIASIVRFISGEIWTLSKLDDIDPKISGQPVSAFKTDPDLKPYFTRVENLTLPITVLRCDYSKRTHTNYLFTIFHRLNTGGMRLNNQEIRNCIYSGTFNELLRNLNQNSSWMKLNKMKNDKGYRFSKQELILRFFAFHERQSQYQGKLANFLNDYISDNRNPSQAFLDEKRTLFERTIKIIFDGIFTGKAPAKMSISVIEALLVGTSKSLSALEQLDSAALRSKYEKLLEQAEFSEQKLSEGLSKTANVNARLNAAISIFSGN